MMLANAANYVLEATLYSGRLFMPRTLAIVHAPGAKQAQLKMLVEKFRDLMDQIDFNNTDIEVNPESLSGLVQIGCKQEISTLIVGWGLSSKPTRGWWMSEIPLSKSVSQLIAIDLYERHRFDGRKLDVPRIRAGKYWSKKTRKSNFKLFSEGYYIKPIIPYAMRRVPIKKSKQKNRTSRKRYVLEPGDPEKVEIVRLIFELFVIHDYTLTDICNLLNSQGVKSPLKSNTWKTRVIRTILESEIYIGANKFSGCVKHGVFPSFIDKSIFFEAQAKISRNQLTLKLRKRSVKSLPIKICQ